MTTQRTGAGRRLDSLVPMVGWLRTYKRGWLRADVIAGVTVAALIVPKNLGYAGIAGIPLQNGLYAAAAGAMILSSAVPLPAIGALKPPPPAVPGSA